MPHGSTRNLEPRRRLDATAPLVAFCDADGSMDPADLPRLVRELEREPRRVEPVLILGRRRPTRFASWPLHARLANAALAWLMRRATGYHLSDLGPMRVTTRTEMLALDLHDRRSGYPLELVLRARDRNWSVREIDVPYFPRVGRSKVTGTLRGTITAVKDMSRLLRKTSSRESAPSETVPAS